MCSGVRKSGWPMPRLIIRRPARSNSAARARTTNALSVPSRRIAPTGSGVLMGSLPESSFICSAAPNATRFAFAPCDKLAWLRYGDASRSGAPGNESGAASSRLAAQSTSSRAALLGAAALAPDNIQRARAIPELQPVPTVKTASDGAKHRLASCARKPINRFATALPAAEDTNEGRPADAPSSALNFRCGHESPRGPTCRIPGGRQRQALNLSENVRRHLMEPPRTHRRVPQQDHSAYHCAFSAHRESRPHGTAVRTHAARLHGKNLLLPVIKKVIRKHLLALLLLTSCPLARKLL